MLRWKILLITGALVLAILLIVGYMQGLNAASECKFVPRTLVGASWDEIRKAAQDFICAKYDTFGRVPEIRLARFVTPVEFVTMFGGGRSDVDCADEQLALIILKGDLKQKTGAFPGYVDVTKLPRMGYVALAFNLRVGVPTAMFASPHGEEFRAVLNDPTIPTRAPAPRQPETGPKLFAVPTLPYPKTHLRCDYDTIVPTVVPPIVPPLPPSTPTRPPYP